jgi:hypothetical protein
VEWLHEFWISREIGGNLVRRMEESLLPDVFAGSTVHSIITEQAFGFEDCIRKGGRTLILEGKPGVGKSATISGIIEHLEERSYVSVMKAFIQHGSTGMHSAVSVLLLFLKQLAVRHGDMDEYLTEIYQTTTGAPKTRPRIKEVSAALAHAIAQVANVCIIIDALDEWSNVRELDSLLYELQALQAKTGVGIILTTRPGKSVLDRYFCNTRHVHSLEVQDKDVNDYVERNIRRSSAYFLEDPKHVDTLNLIKKRILEGAKGVCVLDLTSRRPRHVLI